jgi:hypothetical protein
MNAPSGPRHRLLSAPAPAFAGGETAAGAGRVFLAGDAASPQPRAGGQGMNTRHPGRLEPRLEARPGRFAVATSTNPLLRALRTRLVPTVLPLGLRFDRSMAYGFRTISQLGIGYRHCPAVQEGCPALRRGPRAGDRLPDARVAETGRSAGWARRWPRRATTCCSAAALATGTPANSPPCAAVYPTRWPWTT